MKKRENLLGIPPQELKSEPQIIYHTKDNFIIHKSPKKQQNSFRITKKLLDNLWSTFQKIGKQPLLIITIPDGNGKEYTINCTVSLK
jgi:hypothetical protein